MSFLLLDGLDHYGNGTYLGYAGYTVTGTPAFVTGRYGRGSALSLPADADTLEMPFTASATVYVGVGIKVSTFSDSVESLLHLEETATPQLTLSLMPSGHLALYRSTTRLAIASEKGRIVAGTTYYVEISATINDSTGAYEVWVDGVSVLSGTGADTQETATATVDNLTLLGNTTLGPTFDDVYVVDTTGSAPLNTRLSEVEVDTLRPDAAGAATDWVANTGANYAAVDDPTPDGDATYVEAATITDTDHYNFGALSVTYDTILGVQVKALAKTDTSASMQNQVVSNATEATGSAYALTTTYAYYPNLFLVDPDTAVAWTASGVNAMQAGVELTA